MRLISFEQARDDVAVVSSDTGLFPEGVKFEDAYFASLSKSARKYQLPTEDKPRVPQRRKIALLTIGFILLLGVGGVVIYLVTRELSNKEQHYYSGAASELNKTGFVSRNTHKKEATISVGSFNTIKPSFESSEKPVSLNSSKATVHLPSETRTVSRLLTSITVIESSGLMTRFGTKKDNGPTSPFPTPNLASSMKTTSHWSPVMRTSESDEMKTVSLFSLAHGTSSWNGDDFSKMSSFTESSKENTHSFHLPVSSLAITISTSVAQNAIFSSSSLSAQKKDATGSTSVKSPTATLQDIGTLVKVFASSEANYIWSTLSTAVSRSSVFTYFKSVIEDIDFQLTTTQSDKHSELGRTSSLAITTANLGSFSSSSENSVKVTLGETNMTADMTPIILLTTAKSGVSSSLHSSSFEGGSSGNAFSQQWFFSQSTAPVQTSIVVNYTNVKNKSSYDHYGSPVSMQISPTPTYGFIYGSVTSFKKDHQTSQLFTPLSHTASRLISKEQPSNHSGYLSENTLTVMMTPFPFSSLSSNQGSSDPQEVHTPTTATSLTAKRQSDPTTVVPRSAKLEISTFPLYISPSRSSYSTVAAVEDVTSLETTSSRSSHLKRSSSIGQSQSSIKAIPFSNTVSLNTNSDTGSSSLSSYPGEISSLPVAWVSSHASTSSYTSFEDLPTVTSEITSINSVSTNQTSGDYRSSSILKETFTPREMSSHGNIGLSSVSSSAQVQQLTSKKSIKESPTTFSTIATNNISKTYHHTLHKSTSGVPTKSPTGVRFTRVLTSGQYTALSEGILSLITSSPTDAITSRKISSHSEDARLSIITSSGEHRTPNISHRTSHHLTLYTALSDTPEISTVRLFPVTTVASNTKGILNAVSASRRTSSQVDDVVLSSATYSAVRPRSKETINVSLSRPSVQSVSSTTLHETLVNDSSGTPTNSTVTGISIATLPSSIQSTVLSRNMSSASRIITPAFSNISLNTYNTTHSLYVSTTGNVMIFPNANYTSKTQVKPISTTDSYLLSSVVTTFRPILNTTTQFKIMDGSFIIRNKNFHANLSNPSTTMFKDLADEVEEIIAEIVSEDAKVTSFRNGSVIADFYLMVAYNSPFSDQDYVQMLSEANKTLWRGYFVTNITVTLRDYTERPAARLQEREGLSKGTVVAIFAVFSVLLIAVGSTGVYFCTKKGMRERSRVKPSDSPIPPSELEKIQPVRRGTWVANDEPFLKVDVPKDPNYRSASFYETLSMRVLERNDTEADESCDPDLLRKSTRSPFEPEHAKSEGSKESVTDPFAAFPSTSRSPLSSTNDDDDRPISGSSRNTYLNIVVDSTHSEDEC